MARGSLAIPSSLAMTEAVIRWSPVIMIGRMPACFARAMASFASSRGGSMMPISPANTRSCSNRSSTFPAIRVSAGNVRIGNPERPQRLRLRARHSSRESQLSGRRSAAAPLRPPARASSVRAARPGAPFVNTRSWLVPFGVGVHRAHELALRRERHLTDSMKACLEGRVAEAGFSRGYEERAFCGVSLHAPLSIPFLEYGVVREIGDAKRAFHFHAQRSVDWSASFTAHVSLRRVSRAGQRDVPACRRQRRAPSSRSSSACRSCRRR